ncbi:hypothetical protein JOB18_031750 [Solea senegalensis]|uniref:Scaffolding anchor of CK1 domain-containing protein n=1 Tax=Solea senegalensis TaxID=28829 RepID=A0AAV6QP82_SOLSE|nr:protein FAM83E [Solea senegalensis]KAG7494500.1 hypothetical protein JOB18_031750 [Solea senegalensis]KAG7494501.1 hypothetical protein JOB18_031750 [Solea senegalensis]
MSNSQEQSLDERAVFLEVTESSPEFLYCEKERQALERLLSAGPEAFYSSIDTELSGCFLSPEEVSQVSGWAQDFHTSQLQVQWDDDGVEGSTRTEDLCSTYFPCPSDAPAPDLDLGWPERGPLVTAGSTTVYTSPPAEGEPHIREIIRRHLQKATQVIAIVTDRLTDGAIIGDLHNAASRAVPVYIILNQRSIQENFTLNRLRHPNMRVRTLGGKSFCSKTGRMVTGEMKDKFLLVDLETVIHGSYSLTWTDAHLHRQLITVLRGPVADSFDREFRILFAASHPVADTLRVAGSRVDMTQSLRDLSNLRHYKQLSLESEINNPPSPPPDSLLDWEAMGVVYRDSPFEQHDGIMDRGTPPKTNFVFDKNEPDIFTNNVHHFADRKRLHETTFPVTNHMPDKSIFNNTQPSPSTDLTPERMRRVDRILDKNISRQLSAEMRGNIDDSTATRFGDQTAEPIHNIPMLFSTKRREPSWREGERILEESTSKLENTPSSRKPIILMMPQPESSNSLSDIMKRVQPQLSTSRMVKRGSNAAASEMSQSMMDLSVHKADANYERGVPVPRFKSGFFDPGHMTPAIALMKKRNDELKSALYRTPLGFLPRERPRNSNYGLNMEWRRSLAERELEQE